MLLAHNVSDAIISGTNPHTTSRTCATHCDWFVFMIYNFITHTLESLMQLVCIHGTLFQVVVNLCVVVDERCRRILV